MPKKFFLKIYYVGNIFLDKYQVRNYAEIYHHRTYYQSENDEVKKYLI